MLPNSTFSFLLAFSLPFDLSDFFVKTTPGCHLSFPVYSLRVPIFQSTCFPPPILLILKPYSTISRTKK